MFTKVYKSRAARYKVRLKLQVIKILGRKCACCGEANPLFLTVDHIHNDGAAHRKIFHGSGAVVQVYMDVIQSEHPEKIYQLLCMNCNSAKQWYGICPHQADVNIDAAYKELEDAGKFLYKTPNTVRKDVRGRWQPFSQVIADGGYS